MTRLGAQFCVSVQSALTQSRHFRVAQSSKVKSKQIECLEFSAMGLKPDIVVRQFAIRLREKMGIHSSESRYRQEALVLYEALDRKDQKLLRSWVAGEGCFGMREWAKHSPSSEPFFMPPERLFEMSTVTNMGTYQRYLGLFHRFTARPALMLREVKDFSLEKDKKRELGFFQRLSCELKELIKTESEISNQRRMLEVSPDWSVHPDRMMGSLLSVLESSQSVVMPQSSCTVNYQYQHLDSPKVTFMMFGEGVYIQDILEKHTNLDLSVPYSLQGEVVSREAQYEAASVIKIGGDLVVVLESRPGDIAREMKCGFTQEATQTCLKSVFSDVIQDIEKNPDLRNMTFFRIPFVMY